MKIANKISLYFLIAGLIVSIGAGGYFYRKVSFTLKRAVYSKLDTIIDSRLSHINTYLDMLEISVGQLSKSVILENFLTLHNKKNPNEKEVFKQAEIRLIRTKDINPAIAEFMLMDDKGKVVVSSNNESIGKDESTDPLFLKGQKNIYLKDVYYSEIYKQPLLSVSTPILNRETNHFLGVLCARVKMNGLSKICTSTAGLGETGEVYIVNEDGYMITPSRFMKGSALKLKVPAFTNKDRLLADDEHVLNFYHDYRNVPVLGIHLYVSRMGWNLVAEIDEAEAFNSLDRIRLIFIFTLIAVILSSLIIGRLIANLIARPIRKLEKGTEIIGAGNLDYKTLIESNDEIGHLSRAFDSMTENLKKSTTSIENLNREIADRKRLTYELQEREMLLNETGRLAKVGGWKFDVETMEQVWTQELYLIHEVDLDFKPNVENGISFYVPSSKSIITEAVKRAVEFGEGFDLELEIVTAKGNIRSVRVIGKADYVNGRVKTVSGIFQDVTEYKKLSDDVRTSQQILEGVINAINVRVFWKDRNLVFLGCNSIFARDAGFAVPGDIVGKDDFQMVWHEQAELYRGDDRMVIESGRSKLFIEELQTTPEGKTVTLLTSKVPLRNSKSEIIGVIGTYIDITDRKKTELKIQSLLKEKEILLREVHHRIKNNMNTVSGLLYLQADSLKDKTAISALHQAESRIHSMSILYDKLFRSENLDGTSLKDYLESLIEGVLITLTDSTRILVEKHIEDIPISANTAFTLGIIVNELLTNAIKYAFKGVDKGKLIISASKTDNKISVVVQDNGVGIPGDVDIKEFGGFGLSLVTMLIEQVNGSVRIERQNGTKFTLEVPV